MKRVTLIATALVFAVLAVLTTRLSAQDTNWQQRSFITFSNTVEMPGVTLPAGTYVFRLADIPTRNVVQVLSQDEQKVLGQWLFVQAQRPKVTDDTVVMFKETAENTTPAIQYWYYPGESIGKEFVYPKDQAEKIALRTGQKVRTEGGYAEPNTNASNSQPAAPAVASNDKGTVQGSGIAGVQQQGQSPDVSSDTDRDRDHNNQIAQNDQDRDRDRGNQSVGTSGVNNDQHNATVGTSGSNDATATHARRLPKTASELPLSGFIGLLALAGLFGVRKFAAASSY